MSGLRASGFGLRGAESAAAAAVMTAALGLLPSPALRAQTPAAAPVPSFVVASIKRNTSGDRTGPYLRYEGSQLVVVNNNLFTIIRGAWGALPPDQIIGGPDWVRAGGERYDITAKAPDGTKPNGLMVQALLAERFKLKTHRETRDIPAYVLVMSRPDRRLGPQMSETTFDCKTWLAAVNRGERVPPPATKRNRPACLLQSTPGTMRAGGVAIGDVARILSTFTGGRLVIDRTGLTGQYEFDLSWNPDPTGPRQTFDPPPPVDPNLPSLTTALQEQLGLKLQATTAPVEVLIIDSAERPTPD